MTTVLAILAAFVPYLPVLLQLAGWLISWFGASKENLQQYQDMIEKNKDSGLITVDTYQKLSDFHAQLSAEYEAKSGGKK